MTKQKLKKEPNELQRESFVPQQIELCYHRPLFQKMFSVDSSEKSAMAFRALLPKHQLDLKEFFMVLLLTNSNRLLGGTVISMGSTRSVVVNIKEVFQLVLLSNASAIILGHNHPSGKLLFSKSDKTLTDKIKRISEQLDVQLLDHLIITSESYRSLADDNEL